MNPDPDLERLEERVREAFPPCEHPPISIPLTKLALQEPFFPETSQDCWSRYLKTSALFPGGVFISEVPFQIPPMPTEVDHGPR